MAHSTSAAHVVQPPESYYVGPMRKGKIWVMSCHGGLCVGHVKQFKGKGCRKAAELHALRLNATLVAS